MAETVDLTAILSEIGRGQRSARPLSADAAAQCMRALLHGRVNDLQIGAWWLAMRLKGESASELTAFMMEVERMQAWRINVANRIPCFVMPAYNGARRLANLTPLLVLALRRLGAHVLVHGVEDHPARLTTATLWRCLGWPVVSNAAQAKAALAERGLCFSSIATLHPALARLLAYRWQIGVRSTPHSLVKLIHPVEGSWRLVPVTHGDYQDRLAGWLRQQDARAFVYRGCEGEPAPHPRRQITLHVCRDSHVSAEVFYAYADEDQIETVDCEVTCRLIEDVAADRAPLPGHIRRFAEMLHRNACNHEDR